MWIFRLVLTRNAIEHCKKPLQSLLHLIKADDTVLIIMMYRYFRLPIARLFPVTTMDLILCYLPNLLNRVLSMLEQTSFCDHKSIGITTFSFWKNSAIGSVFEVRSIWKHTESLKMSGRLCDVAPKTPCGWNAPVLHILLLVGKEKSFLICIKTFQFIPR